MLSVAKHPYANLRDSSLSLRVTINKKGRDHFSLDLFIYGSFNYAMCLIMASPNSEHFTSVGLSIRRAKS